MAGWYSLSQATTILGVKRHSLLKLEQTNSQLLSCANRPASQRYNEEEFALLQKQMMNIYGQGLTLDQYLCQQGIAEQGEEKQEPAPAEADLQEEVKQEETLQQEEDSLPFSAVMLDQNEENNQHMENQEPDQWYSDKVLAEMQGQMVFGFSRENDNKGMKPLQSSDSGHEKNPESNEVNDLEVAEEQLKELEQTQLDDLYDAREQVLESLVEQGEIKGDSVNVGESAEQLEEETADDGSEAAVTAPEEQNSLENVHQSKVEKTPVACDVLQNLDEKLKYLEEFKNTRQLKGEVENLSAILPAKS